MEDMGRIAPREGRELARGVEVDVGVDYGIRGGLFWHCAGGNENMVELNTPTPLCLWRIATSNVTCQFMCSLFPKES